MSSRSESRKLRLTWGGPGGITQDEVWRSLLKAGYKPQPIHDAAYRDYEEYAL
jgi:hypothetical protein